MRVIGLRVDGFGKMLPPLFAAILCGEQKGKSRTGAVALVFRWGGQFGRYDFRGNLNDSIPQHGTKIKLLAAEYDDS